MGWKPITIIGLSQFQQCIQEKNAELGDPMTQAQLDIVSECFQNVFVETPPSGGPVLDATPALVELIHPDEPGLIEIRNTGDTALPIDWTATQEDPADWYEIEPPTSGTVTTGEDLVSLNPFWSGSFPADQETTKTGRIIVTGTHLGNPVEGSPKVIEFQATRHGSAPEPPPSGFAGCGDNVSARGTGDWDEWCVDEQQNFVSPGGGVMEMESNAQATRSRLPGTTGRGVAPPTVGSNRVVMTCELKFRQDWLDPVSLGGQHLFVFGEGPYRLPNGQSADDHLRFDFGCFNVGGGNGFRDGFRVQIYSQRQDVRAEVWFPDATKMPGIFRADIWIPVRADGRYDPETGRCTLDLLIAGQGRHVEAEVAPGIIPKLGDSIGWGNVDGRPGRIAIRNLVYRTS